VGVELLCILAEIKPVTQSHHQRSVRQPGHATAEVRITGLRRPGGEYGCGIEQIPAVEAGTDHACVVGILVTVCMRNVEHPAFGEIRRGEYFEQPALA